MENDLIRRSDIERALESSGVTKGFAIRRVVASIPAVDAVEVVRCLECARRYAKDFEQFCPVRIGPVNPYGYCDEGQRRGDGDA